MPNRTLKLRELRKILTSFGCWEERSRGKGSHTIFFREIERQTYSFPILKRDDVLVCYLGRIRRKFRLTPEDGVSDEDFYSRA